MKMCVVVLAFVTSLIANVDINQLLNKQLSNVFKLTHILHVSCWCVCVCVSRDMLCSVFKVKDSPSFKRV